MASEKPSDRERAKAVREARLKVDRARKAKAPARKQARRDRDPRTPVHERTLPPFKRGKEAGPGRRALLDEHVEVALMDAVELGLTREDAARVAGVSLRTFMRYLAKGEPPKGETDEQAELAEANDPYRHLWHAVRKAESAFKAKNLGIIRDAAQVSYSKDEAGNEVTHRGQWQAAAWLLERKHTEEFGRREKVSIEGSKDGPPVQVNQPMGVIVLPALRSDNRGEDEEEG